MPSCDAFSSLPSGFSDIDDAESFGPILDAAEERVRLLRACEFCARLSGWFAAHPEACAVRFRSDHEGVFRVDFLQTRFAFLGVEEGCFGEIECACLGLEAETVGPDAETPGWTVRLLARLVELGLRREDLPGPDERRLLALAEDELHDIVDSASASAIEALRAFADAEPPPSAPFPLQGAFVPADPAALAARAGLLEVAAAIEERACLLACAGSADAIGNIPAADATPMKPARTRISSPLPTESPMTSPSLRGLLRGALALAFAALFSFPAGADEILDKSSSLKKRLDNATPEERARLRQAFVDDHPEARQRFERHGKMLEFRERMEKATPEERERMREQLFREHPEKREKIEREERERDFRDRLAKAPSAEREALRAQFFRQNPDLRVEFERREAARQLRERYRKASPEEKARMRDELFRNHPEIRENFAPRSTVPAPRPPPPNPAPTDPSAATAPLSTSNSTSPAKDAP